MNRLTPAVLVVLPLLLGIETASGQRWRRRCVPLPTTSASESSAKARTPELRQMYALRVEVAQTHYEIRRLQFELGLVPIGEVLNAQTQLLDASIEAATTTELRIRLLETIVKAAQKFYDIIMTLREDGKATEADLAAAKYGLVTAEIRLAEAKGR